MDYKTAGVNIDKGEELVVRIKRMLGEKGSAIGHFGGYLSLPQSHRRMKLVSSIDGVGTKLEVAAAVGRYDTVGQDLVHHCINDIACCGAEPIGFMDYYASAELNVDAAAEVLKGLIQACKKWGLDLMGGETAEMPGIYVQGKFDLAGAIFGLVEESSFIDGRDIKSGDALVGLASNGLHTNGYSLARRVIENAGLSYSEPFEGGGSIGDALLEIHTCYLPEIRALKESGLLKGLAHITGGGVIGNAGRILPEGLALCIDWGAWPRPPIFDWLQRLGGIAEQEMRRTFNLGVGLAAVVRQDSVEQAVQALKGGGVRVFPIGEVVALG